MNIQFKLAILLAVSLVNLTLLPKAHANLTGDFRVRIEGLKNQKGQVCLSIFAASQGFPGNSENAIEARCIKATQTPMAVNFSNLEAGNYAVAVIHDVNGDNTLNRNAFGIPTEGFGFSNNPEILTGPPKFDESSIFVTGSNTDIQVQLRYFLGS